MEQTVKIITIVLVSLFLHLAVLQIRFDSGHIESAMFSSTEVGLVQFSSNQKPFKTGTQSDKITPPIKSEPLSFSSIANDTQSEKQEKSEPLGEPLNRPETVESGPSEVVVKQKKLFDFPHNAKTIENGSGKLSVKDKDERLTEVEQVAIRPEDVASADPLTIEEAPAPSETGASVKETIEFTPVKLPSREEGDDSLKKNFSESGKQIASSNHDGIALIQKAMPRYEINPRPVYPDIALRKGWEGKTLLKVDVKDDGTVERVVVEISSGFKALDRAALKAVRRWQFVPAMSSGVPVDETVVVPIRFDLP